MNWCDTQYHLICHTKWHLYPDTSTKYPLLKWQMDRFPLYVDFYSFLYRGRHGPDRIVVAFTTTYAMMLWVRFSIRVRCTTISGSTGFLYQYNWPSRYITEILLKVSLTTIKQANFTLSPHNFYRTWLWVVRQVSHTKQKWFTFCERLCVTPGYWWSPWCSYV